MPYTKRRVLTADADGVACYRCTKCLALRPVLRFPRQTAHSPLWCDECFQVYNHEYSSRYSRERAYPRHKKRLETDSDYRTKMRSYQVASHFRKAGYLNPDRTPFTIPDRERIFLRQEQRCAICLTLLTLAPIRGREGNGAIRIGISEKAKAHVDHDHRTGVVRGLLCSHCNYGLGAFCDSPELLAHAMDYVAQRPA